MEATMFYAQKETSHGYICGEVRLVLTLLCLLVGGSYLDIGHIFGVKYTHSYNLCHDVLKNWICHDSISKYQLEEKLNSPKEMYEVSKHFAEGRIGGIMGGTIGALDGWLVKIQCPSLKQDGICNPGGYYSHKGFYTLNVQVIVDKKRECYLCFLVQKVVSMTQLHLSHQSRLGKPTEARRALYASEFEQAIEMMENSDDVEVACFLSAFF